MKRSKQKSVAVMKVDDKTFNNIRCNLERITGTKIEPQPLPQYILDMMNGEDK